MKRYLVSAPAESPAAGKTRLLLLEGISAPGMVVPVNWTVDEQGIRYVDDEGFCVTVSPEPLFISAKMENVDDGSEKQELTYRRNGRYRKATIIRRCKNCGQYFITERSNIDYCQRILPGETQTCYVIGPKRVFNKLLSADVPRNLYSKAYKKYQARLRRNGITADEFEEWKVQAKQYLEDVQNGKISLEDYSVWMEQ